MTLEALMDCSGPTYASLVNAHERLLSRVVGGRADAGIRFDDLRNLLRKLGFAESVRGSHYVFRRPGVPERINLQADGRNAKVYQVRQVRRMLIANRLAGGE